MKLSEFVAAATDVLKKHGDMELEVEVPRTDDTEETISAYPLRLEVWEQMSLEDGDNRVLDRVATLSALVEEAPVTPA